MIKLPTTTLTFCLIGSLALIPVSSQAATIYIAFHNGGVTVAGFDSRPDGTVFQSSSQTINNIQNNDGVGPTFSSVDLALADGSGLSGTTLSGTSGFQSFNSNAWPTGTDDYVMMEGWYGFKGADETLSINGIGTTFSNGYKITIYGDADAASGARTMNYTINGVTQQIADDGSNFSGTFTAGANFTVFDKLSLEDVVITMSGSNDTRATVNGIMIESIPEPSSLALLSLAPLALLRRKR